MLGHRAGHHPAPRVRQRLSRGGTSDGKQLLNRHLTGTRHKQGWATVMELKGPHRRLRPLPPQAVDGCDKEFVCPSPDAHIGVTSS